MKLFLAALLGGLAAYWLALGVGIQSYRHWPPGDACDIGWAVATAIFFLGWRRP